MCDIESPGHELWEREKRKNNGSLRAWAGQACPTTQLNGPRKLERDLQ